MSLLWQLLCTKYKLLQKDWTHWTDLHTSCEFIIYTREVHNKCRFVVKLRFVDIVTMVIGFSNQSNTEAYSVHNPENL